ncbi:MAG: TonB-dependent receptor [Alphaproteobacteria bacterium]|nr:TonB-dependent receptor [Alphaproteobacteria bacterium]MBU1513100.1 TonB-dependent receptor [Alphaproteobacteria bacterium]MBU2095208.1 TonB-dependent receptor [Alphaproteobacteria bacterium]MBU2150633.1 TonB-dependent receptor [Alphaproteobacteria bacterium]MBU2306108.1 TonB-dependent receptor [Alphaproteobacteria bacterium]
MLALPGPALAQTRTFNIPSQDAATAIVAFALQAGVQITAPVSRLEGVRTPAVRGALDVRAALGTLLQGTHLAVVRDDGRTITLQFVANADAPSVPAVSNVSELVVTGSRVGTDAPQSSAPLSSRSGRALADTGKTNVQQAVAETGALVGSPGDDERSTGESALNLRNLGQNRTLTLVDSRRFVGGFSGSTAVDINTIPAALIERVDVLTGGASAVYGADAVTGVVNFILKKNFEGLAFDAQYGDAERGAFRDQAYSVTAGRNLQGGRGNVTVNYTFGERPNVRAASRREATLDIHEQVNNPNGAIPRFVLLKDTREAFFTLGGAVIDPRRLISPGGFKGDGTPFVHGRNVGGFAGATEIGGDGAPSYTLFNDDIRPGALRNILTVLAHYDVDERLRPYVDLHLSQVRNTSTNQPTQLVNQPVARDNAYLPANVAALVQSTGTSLNRWDYDGGVRDLRLSKRTLRAVVGAKGDLGPHLQYDVSINHGEVRTRSAEANTRLYDRYLAAMDAVVDPASGRIVCRSDIDPASFTRLRTDALAVAFNPALGPASFAAGRGSGCVPYNPFTMDSSANAQALAWIYQPTVDFVRNSQTVVSGYLSADSSPLFELPGGPVRLVAGAEYRKEKSAADFGPFTGSSRNITRINNVDLKGAYDVSELFGEVSLPLLKNAGPLVRELALDGAYRYSSYSTIGTTQTWKLGGVFATAAGLRFRGAWSKAARAPTIGELFTPATNTVSTLGINDPCATANVSLGTATRRANCETALRALGVNAATFNPLLGSFFPATVGGNPALQEETAHTKTYGVVWAPTFAPGLSLSADHYDIEISGAVITPTTTSVFNACYDASSLDNIFCSLLGRDTGTGLASFVRINAVNVAKVYTSGWELAGAYAVPTERFGRFSATVSASYLQRLELQKTPLPVLTDDRGRFDTDTGGSSPKWVTNVDLGWTDGPWDLNYRFNYSSRTLRNPLSNAQRATASLVIDEPYVKAYINHDVQVGYRATKGGRYYAGVRNLTDRYPDKYQGSLNGLSGRQGYAGRTYYVGLNLTFGDVWD